MKKILYIISLLVLCVVGTIAIPVISDAGKGDSSSGCITKHLNVQGWTLTIKLYNGRLGSARVFMTCDGNFNHDKDFIPGFAVRVSYELPSGDRKEHEDWFPHQYRDTGRFKMHNEFEVFLVGDEKGTGTLSIEVDGREVIFTEYSFDGSYITFGKSYKPEPKDPNIDIDIENEVNVITPSETNPTERRPKENTSTSSVFNITSIPSPADLHVDGNWVGNTPATVELPFGQHKIVVKKKGYKDWEKDLNVSMKGKFSLCAELEKMSEEEIAAASRKIVFSADVKVGNGFIHDIHIMNADGSGRKRLTTHFDGSSEPSVSPDGKRIAFIGRQKNDYKIYVMDIDGSIDGRNVRRLTNSTLFECEPQWSPDGKKIAFGVLYPGNSEIYVIDADGSNLRRLTDNTCWDHDPFWSPDSKTIAWISGKGLLRATGGTYGTFDIHVMNADGSGVKRLTNSPFDKSNPSWSPDGKKITFSLHEDKRSSIYVMNADGSGVERLTNTNADDLMPSWSPDGKQIAFVSKRDGNHEIYVMNSDGSNVRRLTNNPEVDSSPSWCP